MSRRTWMKIAVPMAAFLVTSVIVLAGAGAVDVYLHRRYERSAGLNVWGYRGPVVGAKARGEQRIVVLGGSTAFGYGVLWQEAFPAQLEAKLNERRRHEGGGAVRVVNLAFNNEGAYSYRYTLRDYEYLDYDVALLYAGYNDIGGENTQVYRHQSPVFRLTGYVPILPTVLQEKAMSLRYGGDLDAAYLKEKTTFDVNPAQGAAAATLEATARAAASLGRQLGRFAPHYEFETGSETLCRGEWDFFCRQMHDSIALALSMQKRVIVVSDPFLAAAAVRARQVAQREALKAMIEERFGGRSVRYVDAGDAANLADPSMHFDGMHLTALGNGRVADALVAPVAEVLD